MEQRKNGLGIASLVLGIVGFLTAIFVVGILLDIIAIILGIVAIAHKNHNKGLAIGGVVISGTSILLVGIIFSFSYFLSTNKEQQNIQIMEKVYTEEYYDKAVEKKEELGKTTPTKFYVGDIVKTKNFIIQYLSCEDYVSNNMFIEPKEGFKFIQLTFDFENISDTDQVVSVFDFDGYADGYAVEKNYTDLDLSATLSSGKKAKGTVTFEVPIDANEIQVEYETNFWKNEKIIFIAR